MPFRSLVKVFHQRPGYTNSVIRGSSTPEFVKQHETSLRHIVHDACRLAHFEHESRFTRRNVIACPDARKNFIHYAHTCTVGRYETSYLRHESYQCRLAQKGRLTRHVRSGEYYNLLLVGVKVNVIAHIAFAGRHLRFYHRMSALFYVEHLAFVHNGTHISMLLCAHGKGMEAVNVGNDSRVELQRRYIL